MKRTLINLTLILMFGLLCSYGSKRQSNSPESPLPQYVQDYNKGVDAQDRKDYQTAVTYYQSAIDQKSDFPDALNNLGFCYRQIAKSYLDKAGDAYGKVVKLNPKHEEALEYQGEYFILCGKLDDAYKNYQTLKTLKSKQADVLQKKLDDILSQAQDILKTYSN